MESDIRIPSKIEDIYSHLESEAKDEDNVHNIVMNIIDDFEAIEGDLDRGVSIDKFKDDISTVVSKVKAFIRSSEITNEDKDNLSKSVSRVDSHLGKIEDMPPEMVLEILEHLELKDLSQTELVSKKFHKAAYRKRINNVKAKIQEIHSQLEIVETDQKEIPEAVEKMIANFHSIKEELAHGMDVNEFKDNLSEIVSQIKAFSRPPADDETGETTTAHQDDKDRLLASANQVDAYLGTLQQLPKEITYKIFDLLESRDLDRITSIQAKIAKTAEAIREDRFKQAFKQVSSIIDKINKLSDHQDYVIDEDVIEIHNILEFLDDEFLLGVGHEKIKEGLKDLRKNISDANLDQYYFIREALMRLVDHSKLLELPKQTYLLLVNKLNDNPWFQNSVLDSFENERVKVGDQTLDENLEFKTDDEITSLYFLEPSLAILSYVGATYPNLKSLVLEYPSLQSLNFISKNMPQVQSLTLQLSTFPHQDDIKQILSSVPKQTATLKFILETSGFDHLVEHLPSYFDQMTDLKELKFLMYPGVRDDELELAEEDLEVFQKKFPDINMSMRKLDVNELNELHGGL